MILLWTLLTAVPVVFDGGDAETARQLVAARTGLPGDQLGPVPLDSLLLAQPKVVGSGAVRHCAGSPTRLVDLQAALVRAEGAWKKQDTAGAMDQADLGIAGLGCLSERANLNVASRLFLLRAGFLLQAGQAESARAELVTALALSPELAWDSMLPADGASLLEGVRASATTVPLTLLPSTSRSGPWVDGREPPPAGQVLQVSPGLHLVQTASTAGLRSSWLSIEGPTTLVVPGSYRRPVLEGLGQVQRPDVELLLVATEGGDGVYAVAGGGIWLVNVEDGVPVTTALVEPPLPPPEEKGKKRHGK